MRLHVITAALVMLFLTPVPLSADERTVELEIEGVTALADLVEPEQGAARKGVVLITHGTLAHKDMELVEALQTALAEHGIASLAHTLTLGVDKREGMYDCSLAHTHAHEDALDEIAAWLDWLKKQDAGPVTLLGHSRGGNQTARFAVERAGAEIAGVVLMAPATRGAEGGAAKTYRERFNADLDEIVEKAAGLVASGKPDEMMALPGFVFCSDAKARAASVVSYYGDDPRRDTPSLLPKMKVPVLVIAGSKDTVVPDVADRVGPLADGEKVRLEVIENADHMFLDFYSEDAAGLIVDFVKRGG